MKVYQNKRYFNYRFDFDIGYLSKSPCRECAERDEFPECIDGCRILDKIHEVLIESISCTRG